MEIAIGELSTITQGSTTLSPGGCVMLTPPWEERLDCVYTVTIDSIAVDLMYHSDTNVAAPKTILSVCFETPNIEQMTVVRQCPLLDLIGFLV